ncbi:type IV minor pilin protein PilE [Shewanella sairae]|uniref:Type IV minor pilin protein PilE n=1 Tax=Shewanella sairae TaxID=190310 RepID=A0ABQ4PEJ2_9GAMM|nr:type IV pilin protein [Shewanella sairae]MCL1128658.1 type IV pilin protein [Shewanella sairae]GIU45849.1 type IV minor pilin protein PilE [Shewanella sairae]
MKQKGFSLIELMIVVAIIGILASIAYPSYVQHVAKSARADGVAGLMNVANLQEQYYLDNRQYTADMTDLGLNADPYVVENGFYRIDSTGTTSFIATATAIGAQASRDSQCAVIQITETGSRSPQECW